MSIRLNKFCFLGKVNNSTSLYCIWYSLFFRSNVKRCRFYCSNIRIIAEIDVYCHKYKVILFEDGSSIIIKQKENIARPRFELGSKAPKASMLGHYIRRKFNFPLPGFRAYFRIFYYLYNVTQALL